MQRALVFKRLKSSLTWIDLLLLVGGVLLIYSFMTVASSWTGPYVSRVDIDLSPWALPKYAFFSLSRGVVAYFFSLLFTIGYGYLAARSRLSEKIMIPLLDILQSIPVLGFLPGLVLALVHLFPDSNIGLELACILMIFTGQVWNMTFSFYASLTTVPKDLSSVSRLCGLSRFERLRKLEIPYAMNGLVWNSMLSMAGGWFFLMVVESFYLGDTHFCLPGIGAYMSFAIAQNNVAAIAMGLAAMFTIIILVDRVIWAPLVFWSQRFYDQKPELEVDPPLVTLWLRRSQLVRSLDTSLSALKEKWQIPSWSRPVVPKPAIPSFLFKLKWKVLGSVALVMVGVGVVFLGAQGLYELLLPIEKSVWIGHLEDTFYTFLRVVAAVVLGTLWAVPLGVWIGSHPRWTRRLQPVVQIMASFPAPMIFPMVTALVVFMGVSFEIGAVVLMLLSSQWYILFNAIAGATLIPKDLKNVAQVYQIEGWNYWKVVVLPTIFPSVLNGWITAAGGAWNSSIVSEAVTFGKSQIFAHGIGASITQAAARADFSALSGGIVTMIVALVIINRFIWRPLFHLAETKYQLVAS